jgi:hypothetical protein
MRSSGSFSRVRGLHRLYWAIKVGPRPHGEKSAAGLKAFLLVEVNNDLVNADGQTLVECRRSMALFGYTS